MLGTVDARIESEVMLIRNELLTSKLSLTKKSTICAALDRIRTYAYHDTGNRFYQPQVSYPKVANCVGDQEQGLTRQGPYGYNQVACQQPVMGIPSIPVRPNVYGSYNQPANRFTMRNLVKEGEVIKGRITFDKQLLPSLTPAEEEDIYTNVMNILAKKEGSTEFDNSYRELLSRGLVDDRKNLLYLLTKIVLVGSLMSLTEYNIEGYSNNPNELANELKDLKINYASLYERFSKCDS